MSERRRWIVSYRFGRDAYDTRVVQADDANEAEERVRARFPTVEFHDLKVKEASAEYLDRRIRGEHKRPWARALRDPALLHRLTEVERAERRKKNRARRARRLRDLAGPPPWLGDARKARRRET